MKDEIKEILDRLDFNEWEVDLYKVPITWSELYTIRDYITSLQEENEMYSQLKDEYEDIIEKAIKYIKGNEFKASDGEICYFCNMQVIRDLLNILQGVDNNEN